MSQGGSRPLSPTIPEQHDNDVESNAARKPDVDYDRQEKAPINLRVDVSDDCLQACHSEPVFRTNSKQRRSEGSPQRLIYSQSPSSRYTGRSEPSVSYYEAPESSQHTGLPPRILHASPSWTAMVQRGREQMMFLSPERSLQSSPERRGVPMQCPEVLLSPESSYEATKAVLLNPQGSSATFTGRPLSAVEAAAAGVKSNASYRPASAYPSAQAGRVRGAAYRSSGPWLRRQTVQHSSTSDPRQPRLSTTSAAARRPGTAEPSLRQQRSTGSIGSHRYVLSPKNGNGPLFRPQSAAPSSRDPLPLSTSDDEEDARQKQQEQEDRMRAHEQRVALARSRGKIDFKLKTDVEAARSKAKERQDKLKKDQDLKLTTANAELAEKLSNLKPSVDMKLNSDVRKKWLEAHKNLEILKQGRKKQQREALKDFKTMQDRLEQNASESASAAKAARAAVRKQEKSANEKALEQRLKQRQMSRTMLETANQKERARLATVTSKLHTRDDMAERLERMSEYKLQLKQNKFQQQSTNVQEAVMRELNRRYTNGKMSVPRDMAKRWADVTFLSRRKMDSIPLVYKGNL